MERAMVVLGVLSVFSLLLMPGCPLPPPVLHTLSVSVQGQGAVVKAPESASYKKGTRVTLTPAPEAGWRFDRWTGDVESIENPLTVTVNANMTLTAVFVEEAPISTEYPNFETEVLFDNVALDLPTETAPPANPVFTLDVPAFLATLTVWHDSALEVAPEIQLTNPDGVLLGPWRTTQVDGAPEGMAAYEAIIDAPVPADDYEILNSEQATWLHNAASLNVGFTWIDGVVSETVSRGVIGAGGGAIALADFTLIIPPGAFMDDADLELNELAILYPGSPSRSILVSGLPDNVLQSFALTFPVAPGTADGEAWFPLQVPSSDLSEGVQRMGGSMVRGEVSAGVARVEMSPYEKEAALKAAVDIKDLNLSFLMTLDIMKLQFSRENHFALGLSKADVLSFSNWNLLTTLGDYLEDALVYIEGNMGLPYKSRTMWPIAVRIDSNLSAEAYANREASRNEDYLEFRSGDLDADNQTKGRAIHELFHLVQYDYAGARYADETALGENRFFYDASSTCSEFGFVGDSFFPAQIGVNGGLFCINGIFNANTTVAVGDGQTPSKGTHGYAASLFLRHLTGGGALTLGDLWKKLGDGSSSLHDALAAVTYVGDWNQRVETYGRACYSGGLRDWSRSFLSVTPANRYIRKNHPRLLGYENSWDVPSVGVATTTHGFQAPMAAYSARPFQIRVTGNWNITDAPKLRVQAGDLPGVSLQISAFQGDDESSPNTVASSTILGEALPGQTVEVSLLGWTSPFTVLIVATNPTGLSYPTGYIRAGFIGDCPTLDQLHAIVDGQIEAWGAREGGEGIQWAVTLTGPPPGVITEWQWDDRSFTYQGALTDSFGSGHTRTRTWNGSGEFSSDGCELLRLSGEETYVDFINGENGAWNSFNQTMRLSVVNVPYDSQTNYSIWGDDVRANVVSMSRNALSVTRDEQGKITRQRINFNLGNFYNISAVRAIFYNVGTKQD